LQRFFQQITNPGNNAYMISLLSELQWRGMIHDMTPGLEDHLSSGPIKGYIGFDPTAPSLTIGNYVQIMLLNHLQRAGHQPYILMGGATGRIGDPSGKDSERELKSEEELEQNLQRQLLQMEALIDCAPGTANRAVVVNNYDFYRSMNVLDFLRDVGKYLTINYMLAKDSVQRRMESGISYTEFSYQLLQGYDFVLLNKHHGITLQMGGSDQFGNITAGIELGRKMGNRKLFAVTTPLLTKADGTKFGKSTEGNIWLDPERTSPYRFYQFWINADDQDLGKYWRYFSFRDQQAVEALEQEVEPQVRKRLLAEELTERLHGHQALASVRAVSTLLFDAKAGPEALTGLDAGTLQQVAGEIPSPTVPLALLQQGVSLFELLSDHTGIVQSRSEAKKAVQNNAVSVNKVKTTAPDTMLYTGQLLHGRYLLLENGKKNKYLVVVE
jgi:tyrosyl-tRNA synthetase